MYKPKLIYYHDSRHYLLYRFDPPMSLNQLRKPVDDLIGTGIDTLVYGVGMGQTFLYDTNVGYRFGEKIDLHDRNIVWWRASENLETAIKAGNDPFKIIVDRAHEKGIRIIGSIRINDSGAPDGNTYNVGKLKYENPEVMIGEDPNGSPHAPTSLDFAKDVVREERLAVIEEICDRYGADGIEIDEYIRIFFKSSEIKQNIPILTKWITDVRNLLDQIGKKRNQRLSLSLRIHPSEKANLDIGIDIKHWIQKGIIDWIIPHGDTSIVDTVPDFGWMANEIHKVGGTIYPPLGRETYDDRYQTPTIEMLRATATNFNAAGADGFYLADRQWPHTNKEYQIFREMSDPVIYSRKNKHYALAYERPQNDPHLNKRYLPQVLKEGETNKIPIIIGDDIPAAIKDNELENIKLGLRVCQYNVRDQINIKLNNHPLSISDAKLTSFYGGIVPYFPQKLGMPGRIDTHHWIEFTLPKTIVFQGENILEITMMQQWKDFIIERSVNSVEIWINYTDIPEQIGQQM